MIYQKEIMHIHNSYSLINQKEIVDNRNKSDIIIEEDVQYLKDIVMLIENYNLDVIGVEYGFICGYDNDNNLESVFLVSIGDENNVEFYKRKIMLYMLLSGCSSFISIHNHCNDILQPSKNDVILDCTLKTISNLLGFDYNGTAIVSLSGFLFCNNEQPYYFDRKDDEE